MKFAARLCLLALWLLNPVGPQRAVPATTTSWPDGTRSAAKGSLQHFVCNTGYTLQRCHQDMAVLRKVLKKYPASQLGEWTWVLVRSADWKAIVEPRGLNPDSPAFTYYAGRETFFEEALVTAVPARSSVLLVAWGMSIPDLLEFAVTHELGHALCNEKNEAKAERVADLLRVGAPPSCSSTLQASRRPDDLGRLAGRGHFD